MVNRMKENVLKIKSFSFAVRVVKCINICVKLRKNLYCLNRYCDAGLLSVVVLEIILILTQAAKLRKDIRELLEPRLWDEPEPTPKPLCEPVRDEPVPTREEPELAFPVREAPESILPPMRDEPVPTLEDPVPMVPPCEREPPVPTLDEPVPTLPDSTPPER